MLQETHSPPGPAGAALAGERPGKGRATAHEEMTLGQQTVCSLGATVPLMVGQELKAAREAAVERAVVNAHWQADQVARFRELAFGYLPPPGG